MERTIAESISSLAADPASAQGASSSRLWAFNFNAMQSSEAHKISENRDLRKVPAGWHDACMSGCAPRMHKLLVVPQTDLLNSEAAPSAEAFAASVSVTSASEGMISAMARSIAAFRSEVLGPSRVADAGRRRWTRTLRCPEASPTSDPDIESDCAIKQGHGHE